MDCARTWPSSLPTTASAFTSDPFRGWGQYSKAHIRAQKDPVFHRRAPVLITVDPAGFLTTRDTSGQEARRGRRNYTR